MSLPLIPARTGLVRVRPERRAAPRFAGSTLASIATRHGSIVVEVVDLSRTGACFVLRQGLVPDVGTHVAITLVGGPLAVGTVAWCRGDRFGLVLHAPLDDPELWLDPIAHGAGYMAAIVDLQRSALGRTFP